MSSSDASGGKNADELVTELVENNIKDNHGGEGKVEGNKNENNNLNCPLKSEHNNENGEPNDDTDEDDEDEFVPGVDVDSEVEEDVDDNLACFIEGYLIIDEFQKLHYRGEKVKLSSIKNVSWNFLDRRVKALEEKHILEMNGECDIDRDVRDDDNAELTPRRMHVTFTQQNGPISKPQHPFVSSQNINGTNGKDEDCKQPSIIPLDTSNDCDSKLPSFHYQVYGRQIYDLPNEGSILEFCGDFYPEFGKRVFLRCQARLLSGVEISIGATTLPAAAAVAKVATRSDDDDDDDDLDDADNNSNNSDDDVDYNELIALHEDAGLSVDALRKRYCEDGDASTNAKEITRTSKKRSRLEREEDDDEYGF